MQEEVEVEDSQVHKREDFQVHKRDDSQVHKRVPCLSKHPRCTASHVQFFWYPMIFICIHTFKLI